MSNGRAEVEFLEHIYDSIEFSNDSGDDMVFSFRLCNYLLFFRTPTDLSSAKENNIP